MAKTYKKRKKLSWKKLLSAIAVVVILLGTVAAIRSCTKDETKTIGASAFSRGGLDENGEYVNTDKTLYTKDMFECKGLVITPDFESNVSFQVYFYNVDGLYFASSDITSKTTRYKVPDLAKYARVVLIPDSEEDIKFTEVYSLAKSVEVSVLKKQNFAPTNYYELAKLNTIESASEVPEKLSKGEIYFYKGHYMGFDASTEAPLASYSASNVVFREYENVAIKLDCDAVQKYILRFGQEVSSKTHHIFFFKANGDVLMDDILRLTPTSCEEVIVDVPSEAAYMIINVMSSDSSLTELPIVINEYLPR